MKPSLKPEEAILRLAYPGQDPNRRRYHSGYETYFAQMPHINSEATAMQTKSALLDMAAALKADSWTRTEDPGKEGFIRSILALEEPIEENGKLKEGSEILIAKWGTGFTTPPHGHSAGYIHEDILFGRMRVNTYRLRDDSSDVVRPLKTEIVESGLFASTYADATGDRFERQKLIHNFTALEFSATVHFLPGHIRDGRDNRFRVEYFDDWYLPHVIPITPAQGMYLQKGEVVLVRSSNVPEYGDHYIVITGHPIPKPHGIRPQEMAIHAPNNKLLDHYKPIMGVTMLKLDEPSKRLFHDFHGIRMGKGKVIL